MAAAEGEKKMVTPKVSSDGEEFEVEARVSRAIRRTIEGDRADNSIPQPRCGSFGNGKEVEYRGTKFDAAADAAASRPRVSYSYTSDDDASPTTGGGLRNRDAGFAKVDKATQPAEQRIQQLLIHMCSLDFGALRHHQNIAPAHRRPAGAARRARRAGLLINFGAFLVCTTGSFIVYHTARDPSAIDDPAFALVAFLFVLLGVWFALLALVADQFPGVARVADAIARALKGYLLGLGN